MKCTLDFSIVLVFVLVWQTSECLECFSCKNITDPQTCNSRMQCRAGENCFLQETSSSPHVTFDMGCQSNQLCSNGGVGPSSVVGRSLYTRQQLACHECCSSNGCNEQLCLHKKPSTCIDDTSVDCARLNTVLNVCADVNHAKSVCPKFCGLCNLVDGNWAAWSSWSSCDVTCNNGTQIRTRTCTNPVPQNGGLECQGSNNQIIVCVNQLCPVHGGWARWSGWSSCSVTCDTGLSKRTRSCTNPIPDRFGDNCFGDSQDYRVCMDTSCSSWTSWNAWGDCSVTCGLGERTRNRTCVHPSSSPYGRPCIGNHHQTKPCRNQTCEMVLFNFYGYSMTSTRMRFLYEVENLGNAYDSYTGYFVAPVAGNYFFSYQICFLAEGYDYYLYKANKNLGSKTEITRVKHYSYNLQDCSSTTVLASLQQEDHVWVQASTSPIANVDSTSERTTFSGGLLTLE
ncbi:hemicentin-1-like [Mya arenaria]|uniref:hemicentin-1-like n=1 Tax=Mya arenaria TaxID=6604 RepID=UPI0022E6BD92|nr:hemicentin-1-like [Mya arenaria]